MTATLPEGYVVHMPPQANLPRREHQFGPAVVMPAMLSVSGCEQHERTCISCGAVKVTIIGEGGNHRRAWRKNATARQVETFAAPLCEPSMEKQHAV